jgi:hypothetical protein
MVLAGIRSGDVNLPLFFHIAGAMALVASLVVALYAIRIARTRGDQPAAQFAFRVLLRATLPAYLVMRIAAQITYSNEHLDKLKSDPGWIGIGFGVSDFGFLLLLVGLVLTGLMARRAKAGASVAGAAQLKVATGLAALLMVLYVVAIWAMTAKPA